MSEPPSPRIVNGSLVSIRRLEVEDARVLLDLRVRNRTFLEPWEPLRAEDWYSLAAQIEDIEAGLDDWQHDRGYRFAIVRGGCVIGGVSLSEVVRGVFDNAYLGWYVDEAHGRLGFGTEAVRLLIDFAFADALLHRVQAAIIPRNVASLRLARKVGFREEGLALRYLRINGTWEDHKLFALTSEEWTTEALSR
jgi:ribosomal-protein-alanine N-acetyltransferase